MTLWKINMCMKRILYCFLGLLSIAAFLGCRKEEKFSAQAWQPGGKGIPFSSCLQMSFWLKKIGNMLLRALNSSYQMFYTHLIEEERLPQIANTSGNDISYRALMRWREMKALCRIWRISGLYNQRLVLILWQNTELWNDFLFCSWCLSWLFLFRHDGIRMCRRCMLMAVPLTFREVSSNALCHFGWCRNGSWSRLWRGISASLQLFLPEALGLFCFFFHF